jgi:hypothetical protein
MAADFVLAFVARISLSPNESLYALILSQPASISKSAAPQAANGYAS